ncbi:MAG: hypothetical protein IKU78_08075 [Paludibacteraceae bacterium]|nr:hypothetical protein [Paludibacteraceae bacterium]
MSRNATTTEPVYERATDVLYQLEAIYYQNKAYARYPRFKIDRGVRGYFHSWEEAEKRIQELVNEDKQNVAEYDFSYEYYGFEVREVPFDCNLESEYDAQCIRTYADDGEFLHETLTSNISINGNSETFVGRPNELCRFKVGDLVEVCGHDMVSLQIVYAQPPTPSDLIKICQRSRNYVLSEDDLQECAEGLFDYSDDSYTTLYGDRGFADHDHPCITKVFPVRRKVSATLREKLQRGLEKAQRGDY